MVPLSPNPFYRLVVAQIEQGAGLPAGSLPEFTNLDSWDGYPAERARLLRAIEAADIDDTVVLTGDIHSSWSSDLPVIPYPNPPIFTPTAASEVYFDPLTQQANPSASVAVEFVTTSVTSGTFSESAAGLFQAQGLPVTVDQVDAILTSVIENAYPQVRSFNLRQRGYLVLDLSAEAAQGDWFYVAVDAPEEEEVEGAHMRTASGANTLTAADAAAPPKDDAPELAPTGVRFTNVGDAAAPQAGALIVGAYPNPTRDRITVGYVLAAPSDVRVTVYDALGRQVRTLFEGTQAADAYALGFEVSGLASGAYLVRVETAEATASRAFVVQR